MLVLKKATAECPLCERKFHQIDGTEERALSVVRAALDAHITEAHITEAHQGGDPR